MPVTYFVPYQDLENFIQNCSPEGEVYPLDLTQPIPHQLLQARVDLYQEIELMLPETMPIEYRNQALTNFKQSLLSMRITEKTFGTFAQDWINNSLMNKEKILNSKLVTQLPKAGSKAIIVGSGPSATKELVNSIPDEVQVFSCWGAAHLFDTRKADYICQADPNAREGLKTNFDKAQKTIVLPQACPLFLNVTETKYRYAYLEPCSPCNSFFASEFNVPLHQNVIGTVASLMVNSAIYADCTEIALIGVDMAWLPDTTYDSANNANIEEITNSHGITLSTYNVFKSCKDAFFSTIMLNPGINIYQTSKNAIDMLSVGYKSLDDFIGSID